MNIYDDNGLPLLPQELQEKYGFDPGEREALSASIADRQRAIDAAETLAWCQARDEERRLDAAVVTKDYSAPTPRRAAPAPAPALPVAQLRREMKAADQRVTRILAEATGEALADLRKQLRAEMEARLQAEIAQIKIAFLEQQLEATKNNVSRLKTVGPSGSMIA